MNIKTAEKLLTIARTLVSSSEYDPRDEQDDRVITSQKKIVWNVRHTRVMFNVHVALNKELRLRSTWWPNSWFEEPGKLSFGNKRITADAFLKAAQVPEAKIKGATHFIIARFGWDWSDPEDNGGKDLGVGGTLLRWLRRGDESIVYASVTNIID